MRRLVRAHREIAIVLALFVALGIVYSTTTPLFEAPDEQWHFAFVQYVATGRGLPVQSEQPTHLARQEASQPPLYYLLAAGVTFWIDTSDYPGIVWENPHYGYNVPGIVNDNKNLFIHTSLENFPYRGAALAVHIARWLSVLMGALAVLFTYLLALEISERVVIATLNGVKGKPSPIRESEIASGKDHRRNDRRGKMFAASAGAVVAFVPQFLFISSAVSNDSTIVALAALALWLMARLLNDRRRPTADGGQRSAVVLGIACGLAALAKVSGLGLFALAVVVFVWHVLRQSRIENRTSDVRHQKSEILFRFLLFAFTFLLVAGWWYARNLLLYGELTGTAMMSQIFYARQTPLTFAELGAQLREVWETFWVGFGWGNIRALPVIYTIIASLVVVSGIGWVIGIQNSKFKIQNPEFAIRVSQFAILFAWVALMFAALMYWMQTTQAPHGRLFFPALPALAVLLAAGLAQFQISDFRFQISNSEFRISNLAFVHFSFVIFLFTLAALAPFLILQPAYAYPQTLSENDIPQIPNRVDISYDDKIKLLGYDVSSRRVSPGSSTELTLYWRALATMDEDYSIGISIVDPDQRVVGARDSYPGHGMLPTRLWFAGQTIRDVYWLPINADAPAPSIAQIHIAVYERVSKRDLVARDPHGEIITPFIGQIEIVRK